MMYSYVIDEVISPIKKLLRNPNSNNQTVLESIIFFPYKIRLMNPNIIKNYKSSS